MSLPDILLPKIRHFGLSVERQSLHAVELDSKGRLVRSAEIQLASDTFVDSRLVKTDEFAAAITALLAQGKFSTRYVAVTFPEVFAFTRGYTVPALSSEEIQEAISWHSKDLFPFPADDIYFDWKTLSKTDHECTTAVVAVQKTTLDPLLSALAGTGLTPLRFEPDASALARLLHGHTGKHTLVIDVNPQGAYVTLVEGEKALFTTVVNYTSDDTPDTYLKNIDQTLSEISSFYKAKGVIDDASTEIVVTGQMASEDWVRHVSELLKYPAALLSTDTQSQSYNKAYAAAFEQIAPPIDPESINLMPIAFQQEFDVKRTTVFYRMLLSRAIIAVLFPVILTGLLFVSATITHQTLDAQVKKAQALTQSQETNTQSLLQLNSQAKSIVALGPLRVTPRKKLEALLGLLNDKISITQWEFDDVKQEFKVSGTAATRDDLLAFKNKLDTSENFARVMLPLGSLETPVQVPFTVSFLVKK